MSINMRHAAAAASIGLLLAAQAAFAVATLQPPFAGDYTLSQVDPPGFTWPPSQYAGLAFKPGDFSTLYFVTHAYEDTSAVYAVGLLRDVDQHVVGFTGDPVLVATSPGLPGTGRGAGAGLAFGPDGALLFTSTVDNSFGEIANGSNAPDKHIDLSSTAILTAGAIGFVPPGFAGSGHFKLTSTQGQFFDVTLLPDGSGAFDIGPVVQEGTLPLTGNNFVTGIAYVAAGNPRFTGDSILESTCDYNTGAGSNLTTFRILPDGQPDPATPRVVATDLCVSGMVSDPATGDMLFSTIYGFPKLLRLSGFNEPLPSIVLSHDSYSVSETAGPVNFTVLRQGGTSKALAVDYATSGGTAVDGVNYTGAFGTLHWAPGASQPKHFTVPVLHDGVYTPTLTVGLGLPGPAERTLTIRNVDAKPSVSLTSIDRMVSEAVGTVQLTAALSHAAGVPVTVPFKYTGTATRNKDYKFALDGGGNPILTLVIPAGSTSAALDIHVVNDKVDEDDETLTATMGKVTNAVAGAVQVNTLTIADNDPRPTVEFASATSTIVEGSNGAGQPVFGVVVTLSKASARPVSVQFTLTAGALDDRIATAAPMMLLAPGLIQDFSVQVADDAVHEGNKDLTFKLSSPTNAVLGAQKTHTVTVQDDD
jgi:hypothetical protein